MTAWPKPTLKAQPEPTTPAEIRQRIQERQDELDSGRWSKEIAWWIRQDIERLKAKLETAK